MDICVLQIFYSVVILAPLVYGSPKFGFTTQALPVFDVTQPLVYNPNVAPSVQYPDYDYDYDPYAATRENPETELIHDLFSKYDKVARPVLNMSKSAEVNFGYRLLSIQLNEVDQLLTSFVWLPHRWSDERLTWDPARYGDIEKLIIPNRMLWLPDTFLYQSSDDTGYVTSFDRVPLDYTGRMEWWPSATLLSPCIIDVTYFPFDYQTCSLTMGPWGYHSDQVNYTIMDTHANLDRYTVSGAWELMDTNISREVQFYPDLNMSYTLIDITIKLKRKALYYWLNIIIPCIILNSLGIGLFILPADSGEKVSFGLGILLTVFVFAILVNENIPKTSDYTPVMGIYLAVIMSMIAFSLIIAIVIENLHHRRPKLNPVPKWVRVLFLEKLPHWFGMQLPQLPLFTAFTMQGITPKKKKRLRMMRRIRQMNILSKTNRLAETETLNIKTEDVESNGLDTHANNNSNASTNGAVDSTPTRTPEPTETEEERLREAYKNMPFDEKDNDEWILVALVMDNLLGWVFFALLIMTTGVVLVIIPLKQSIGYN